MPIDKKQNQINQTQDKVVDDKSEPVQVIGSESLLSEEIKSGQRDDFSSFKINKKGFIEIDGKIIETLPSITFKARLENGYEILAHLSGRMRMNRIMLIPGDKVKIEMSPYDLTKGRIIYRY